MLRRLVGLPRHTTKSKTLASACHLRSPRLDEIRSGLVLLLPMPLHRAFGDKDRRRVPALTAPPRPSLILKRHRAARFFVLRLQRRGVLERLGALLEDVRAEPLMPAQVVGIRSFLEQIGRASCRERGDLAVRARRLE